MLESGYCVLAGYEGPAGMVPLAKPTDVGAAWEEELEADFGLPSSRLTIDRLVMQWIGVVPRQKPEVVSSAERPRSSRDSDIP